MVVLTYLLSQRPGRKKLEKIGLGEGTLVKEHWGKEPWEKELWEMEVSG